MLVMMMVAFHFDIVIGKTPDAAHDATLADALVETTPSWAVYILAFPRSGSPTSRCTSTARRPRQRIAAHANGSGSWARARRH